MKYIPSIATQKKLIWTSSDLKVATVSPRGVVVGKGTGNANITVEIGSPMGRDTRNQIDKNKSSSKAEKNKNKKKQKKKKNSKKKKSRSKKPKKSKTKKTKAKKKQQSKYRTIKITIKPLETKSWKKHIDNDAESIENGKIAWEKIKRWNDDYTDHIWKTVTKKDEKMQGLTGYGKRIWFLKLYREYGKTLGAFVCTCKITNSDKGGYKIIGIDYLPGKRWLSHANGMTAVRTKAGNGTKTRLYIAPCEKLSSGDGRYIYAVDVNSDGSIGKPKQVFMVNSKQLDGEKFRVGEVTKINSIASWTHNKKQYLIMNCAYDEKYLKNRNYIFSINKNNKLVL